MFWFYIIILSSHIIIGLLTGFARTILRNTGPWSFSTALASSGCTKTAVLYFSVWLSHPVNKPLIRVINLNELKLIFNWYQRSTVFQKLLWFLKKQTSIQFDQSRKKILRVCWGSSIRCEIQGASLKYLLTVLLKQYVSCKLSFNEVFVIFVDLVLR